MLTSSQPSSPNGLLMLHPPTTRRSRNQPTTDNAAKLPFLILIVLDGFGCRKETESNAIAQADTPRFDRLFRESPWTTLEASGRAVGLPREQMGNSEVGHLNIGAGRIVEQDIVRIGKAVSRHELEASPVLVDAVRQGKAI